MLHHMAKEKTKLSKMCIKLADYSCVYVGFTEGMGCNRVRLNS